jgi:hypothetical protein
LASLLARCWNKRGALSAVRKLAMLLASDKRRKSRLFSQDVSVPIHVP